MQRNVITKTYRSEQEKHNLNKRLNIINGQINGLKQMIEYNRGCSDVLIQICAVTSSLKSIGNEILKGQLAGVLETDITDEKIQALDEAVDLFSKLNK